MQFVKTLLIFGISILLLLYYNISPAQNLKWVEAELVYNNGGRQNGLIKARKNSCFAFMKCKTDTESKAFVVHPDEVNEVITDAFHFFSIHFNESDHFIKSSSFGILHGGNEVKLLETTFFYKSCSCNSRGSYRRGYFLWSANDYMYVKLHAGNIVSNPGELNIFLSKHNFEVFSNTSSTSLNDLLNHLNRN